MAAGILDVEGAVGDRIVRFPTGVFPDGGTCISPRNPAKVIHVKRSSRVCKPIDASIDFEPAYVKALLRGVDLPIGCVAQFRYGGGMVAITTHHGTVDIERTIEVPLTRAYAAFADETERSNWAAPSDTSVFVYEEKDFRVGGRDVARCGPASDPRFRVETRYVDIVPEARVVSTETIHDSATLLATNITTVEFLPEATSTRIRVTVQVTSFVGPGMIENTRVGQTGSLAHMARYLEKAVVSARLR
jgi:uncharacterized protein YndB with AHSA1/START domain